MYGKLCIENKNSLRQPYIQGEKVRLFSKKSPTSYKHLNMSQLHLNITGNNWYETTGLYISDLLNTNCVLDQ